MRILPDGLTRPPIKEGGCVTWMSIKNCDDDMEFDVEYLKYSHPIDGHLKVTSCLNKTASNMFVIDIRGFSFHNGRDVFPTYFTI